MIKVFYEEVIKEASMGNVESYFTYNLLFNTSIPECGIKYEVCNKYSHLLVPTLYINNKGLFDKLLGEYLVLALEFYSEDPLFKEFSDNNYFKCKTILSLLWSNASFDDFLNPLKFLTKRIEFLKNEVSELSFQSDAFNACVKSETKKSAISSETPYCFKSSIDDGENSFALPDVYYGICDNSLYIYAIQKSKKISICDEAFYKNINRKFYKINGGIDVKNDTYENYGEGNLKDITPSFMYAAFLLISSSNVDKVYVDGFLPLRWNAKEIISMRKKDRCEEFDLEKSFDEHVVVQNNLTQKFMRNFYRIEKQVSGINLSYSSDSPATPSVFSIENSLSSENILLSEVCTSLDKQKSYL